MTIASAQIDRPPPLLAPGDPARGPSVLILTKNEQDNIAACLKALSWCDDIVILDSVSTDRTVQIAKAFPNVRIFERPFDTEWKQRNYGLHEIAYKHRWVYICDADEIVVPELRQELLKVTSDPAPVHSAYRLRYKNMFFGRWIRRSSGYPVWLIRLVQPLKVRYEIRQTNVHPIVDGSVGSLNEHFDHYSFRSGLRRWFAKHNFYSSREAMEAVKVRRAGFPPLSHLFGKDPMLRRRAAKNMSFFLRFRAGIRWVHDCFVRLALLDGIPGLRYITLVAMYEYWLELKMVEQLQHWQRRNEAMVRDRLARKRHEPEVEEGPPLDPQSGVPLVDIMIPTLNESAHIAETVRNALKLGPVYVLDSHSTDATQELARQAGATVVEHTFENYSKQKNWGLDNLPMKGQWVFILDADERLTPELLDELREIVYDPQAATGYYVNRVVIMMGRAVWHGGMFPSWNLRFFKRGYCRYENRSVHEHMICDGPTDYARYLMLHIRRESINDYLEKHIRYADMESDEWVRMKVGTTDKAKSGHLFRDILRWRMYLRRDIWPNIPGKPLVRFMYMYVFRLGFLDGSVGWHLANLMASYEYMIEILYKEKMERVRAEPPETSVPERAISS